MSELPKGWIETTFENLIDSITNGIADKQNKECNGIPVSRIETIADETINYARIGYVADYDDVKAKKYALTAGDILFSHINSPLHLGKTAIFDGAQELFHGTNLLRIVIDKRVTLPYYFNYYCKFTRAIGAFSLNAQHAVNQSSLNQKKIKAFSIPLAPLVEQKRIVEKLDEVLAQVDTIKARLDGIPALLKRFRQSVLASAVSGKLTSQDVSTQSSLVGDPWSHEVKAPSHWNLYEFKQAVKITGGSQPPKSEFKAEYEEGLVRLIQIRDYKSDKFLVYIPLDKAKRFCTEKDIMIGRYGPPIFQILRGISGAYNVALMKAEPAIDDLDLEYLYRFLQNPKLFHYIDAGSDRTAGQAGVNKKFLESYPLFVPPLEEQKEIVRLVDQYFAFADTIEAQVKKVQARVDNLAQSILAKAFRGELVPQDPNDEPADKLLERIALARKEAEALAKAAKKAEAAKKKVAKSV
ncbi:restriction endonuclease subunit S [Vibrio harveyi]|uniref:restriction endonuclease subunit S n=1 Tax=Vibrio harveyi TaxID=669 RepID=UPI001EFC5330|nr:restriction endonuclease subunit S [Vibrio harveyi]MCG9612246.1 restriction endonuclease subunit S [Vibrio harveyi]MCG9670524.1 restriction endonuclease subunit S [Vibrio harveyi]